MKDIYLLQATVPGSNNPTNFFFTDKKIAARFAYALDASFKQMGVHGIQMSIKDGDVIENDQDVTTVFESFCDSLFGTEEENQEKEKVGIVGAEKPAR